MKTKLYITLTTTTVLGSLSAQTWKTCLEVAVDTYCESVFTANS